MLIYILWVILLFLGENPVLLYKSFYSNRFSCFLKRKNIYLCDFSKCKILRAGFIIIIIMYNGLEIEVTLSKSKLII